MGLDVRSMYLPRSGPGSELSDADRRDLRRQYMRAYYHRPHVKARQRRAQRAYYLGAGKAVLRAAEIARRYGLTQERLDEMTAEQGGLCAMGCGAAISDIDHDHATGKVRGLLCRRCNVGLGFYEKLHEAARAYLVRAGAMP